MKVIRSLDQYLSPPYPVLTIGNFDGLHRGHQSLLCTVVKTAMAKGGTSLVLTFDPHPMTVLAPAKPVCFLTTVEEKLTRFRDVGIDEVLCLPFDTSFAALTPEEFVYKILRDRIGARELYVGEQFAFGQGRSGRMSDLVRLSTSGGFAVHALPPVLIDDEIVSSTRIRAMIQAGDVSRAKRFLGRWYELGGVVIEGAHRGQSLGWPTANVRLPPERVIPADGVYAVQTFWDTRMLESVAYIGTRPTFGVGERLLEVYLLDEQVQLYGQEIRVRFVQRLREDRAFESGEELARQIELDVRHARETLKTVSLSMVDT